jgi:hypothetical protein
MIYHTPRNPAETMCRGSISSKSTRRHGSITSHQPLNGQLECVIALKVPWSAALRLSNSETIVVALVRTCDAEQGVDGLWQYTCFRNWEFVNLTAVKCLVRQVRDGEKWTIIDHRKTKLT